MIHALRLKGGKAHWYKSSYVGAASVQKKLHRSLIPGKTQGVADAVNTNVINFAGKIWALVEAGAYPVEVNSKLESERHHLLKMNRIYHSQLIRMLIPKQGIFMQFAMMP